MRSTIRIAGVETFTSSGGNRFTTFKLQPFAGAAYSVENNPTLMGSEGDEWFFKGVSRIEALNRVHAAVMQPCHASNRIVDF